MSNVANITTSLVNQIYNNGNLDKATLSSLRSAPSFLSERARRIWPMILPKLDEKDLSRNGVPTYAENAIFVALRSYAIMQQANERSFANGDQELFEVLAELRQISKISEGVNRRVKNLFLSTSFTSLQTGLVQLVKLLKSNLSDKQVNFAKLAKDLFFYQTSNENAKQVFLKWGQQYYRTIAKKEEGEN